MSELHEEQIHRGDPDKPLVLMVHGHGASQRVFTDPYSEALRDRDDRRMIPFDWVLTNFGPPDAEEPFRGPGPFRRLLFSTPLRLCAAGKHRTFWDQLSEAGYSMYTWSQSEPNDTIAFAIDELKLAVPRALELFGRDRLILLTHSRGGLVARAYLHEDDARTDAISGLIQLAPPNQGSRMAWLSRMAGKLGRTRLLPFLLGSWNPEDRRFFRHLSRFVMDVVEYLRSAAIEELMPGSGFMRSLASGTDREAALGIPTHVLIGNSPAMLRVFLEGADGAAPRELVAISSGYRNPIFPAEIRDGMGDGLVAVDSTKLAYAKWYPPYPVNHGTILIDAAVQEDVLALLEQMS